MKKKDVLIIGSGLAGLACSLELLEAGRGVQILEAKDHLGGRTSSWIEDGMEVESGLHRVLGIYQAFPAFLKKAGLEIDELVSWGDEVEIRLPDRGHRGVFGLSPLHRPLKTVYSFLGNNLFLNPLDKLRLSRFFRAGLKDHRRRPGYLDSLAVSEYAKKWQVGEEVLFHFLTPLSAGIFFLPPEKFSAFAFFSLLEPVFSRFMRNRVGAFVGGMTDVLADPVAQAIRRKGGRILTGLKVEKLLLDKDGRMAGISAGKKEIRAGQVVLAVDLGSAQRLVRRSFGSHSWFKPMLELPTMPAATLQLELFGPALKNDRPTFGPGTALSSFAEQSRTTFKDAWGRLSAILSPPDRFLNQAPNRIFQEFYQDAQRLDLKVVNNIKEYRAILHPEEFYSLSPGNHSLRPSQTTPIEGLVLAGDYTAQEFLTTMEGAVISGERAAAAILGKD